MQDAKSTAVLRTPTAFVLGRTRRLLAMLVGASPPPDFASPDKCEAFMKNTIAHVATIVGGMEPRYRSTSAKYFVGSDSGRAT